MKGLIGLNISPVSVEAHIIFADGKTSSLINRGVLIVPDKAMPTFNVEVNVDGIGAS